ncbi:hypothetical protein NDU88_000404 [Pleurodeles waltl]|uniref:Uncharacterized protein n=1 Tax=Pleurodeles waltl TaxID=8319 RepID=A0AAV7KPC8_PLEWA|nr:hypothetical protein NDU88_000404 [Pleurodeles waltl]
MRVCATRLAGARTRRCDQPKMAVVEGLADVKDEVFITNLVNESSAMVVLIVDMVEMTVNIVDGAGDDAVSAVNGSFMDRAVDKRDYA